jgi:thioredoxin-related protein
MRRGAFFPEAVSNMLLTKISRRALLAAILAFIIAPAAAQEQLAYADDLPAIAAEAAARRVPLMIVFTESSCPYCTRAKRDYLVPLQARGPFANKVIVREVDVSTDRRLRGFDGVESTHREFGRIHQVRRVPTVVIMDPHGEPLAQAVVGLLSEDFYRLTLEQAIEEGLFKLRAAR